MSSQMALQAEIARMVDFYHVFDTEMYDHYLIQLEKFLAKHPLEIAQEKPISDKFQKEVIEFVSLLKAPPKPNTEARRIYHIGLINKLRHVIALSEESNRDTQPAREMNKFIDAFVWWMFTKVHVEESMESFLVGNNVIPSELEPGLEKREFIQVFSQVYDSIKKNPRFLTKTTSTTDIVDDLGQGNVPTVIYTLNTPAQTVVFTTPNTTREIPLDEKTVISMLAEEFQRYAEIVKMKKKRHLYINLMRRQNAYEGPKSKLIEEMDNYHSFFVVTLDKSKTSFYYQNEEFASDDDAARFKHTFIEQMFSKDGNFYWPKSLDAAIWRADLIALIDEVHQGFFSSKPTLSVEERLDFIELSYLKIVEALVRRFEPHTLNMTCKHSKDRGPSLFTLVYLQEQLNGTQEPNALKTLALFYAPPLITNNRPSHSYRVHRFITAATRLIEMAKPGTDLTMLDRKPF
jgi:hypothetical protein